MPPLRLNFKKKQVNNTVFAGQDKLKLVTHCKNAFEQFVLQEYLAYKIYTLLTEKSFRVRLVRITYEDTEGKAAPLTKYAFFIEFDFSGFINAPYATPNAALHLKSVQERRFMGVCRTEEAFAAVFALFHRHKEAIYALVRNLAPLEKEVADRSLAYFDAFYEALADPRTVQDAFLGTCLKP